MSSPVTTTVTELPESRVRVEAEVAPVEVERRLEQAARRLANNLKIPGFRKGKVPPPVVMRRLGREYVMDETVRTFLSDWYIDALNESGIAPVGQPEINVGDSPDAGKPLSFTIEIGVRPKAKLGKYKGIEVGKREATAEPAAIDAEVERLRDRFATLDTVERAAELGDHVVMDYVGKLEGVPFEGGEGHDQLLELGSGQLIPGFEEQLVGAKAGDERLVEVTFPEEYGAEHLSGKPATFEVTVSEIKAKSLPELNDDFASDAAGFDTLGELRDDIATRLKEFEEDNVKREFERDVLDAVAAGSELELPHQLVHARAHEVVEETVQQLSRQGISKEMYLQITGATEEDLANQAEEEAEQSLRRESVIAAVVEAEQIDPSDAEVLEALEPTAERNKTTADKLFEDLQKNGGLVRVRRELASNKAVQLLVEEAKAVPKAAEPDADADAEATAADAPKAAEKPKAAKKPAARKKPAAKKPAAEKPAKDAPETDAADAPDAAAAGDAE
jgi:trigger factor